MIDGSYFYAGTVQVVSIASPQYVYTVSYSMSRPRASHIIRNVLATDMSVQYGTHHVRKCAATLGSLGEEFHILCHLRYTAIANVCFRMPCAFQTLPQYPARARKHHISVCTSPQTSSPVAQQERWLAHDSLLLTSSAIPGVHPEHCCRNAACKNLAPAPKGLWALPIPMPLLTSSGDHLQCQAMLNINICPTQL